MVEVRRLCHRSRKRLYLLGLECLGVHMQMGSRRLAQERWRRLADPSGAEGARGKELALRSLSGKDLLEKEMATHSSILAWKIPWTEEPGGLQSKESQRVGHD